MTIEILKKLKDYPSDGTFTDQPISLSEIEELEQEYNNGAPFPKSLKELLYLAGKFCNVLDYGMNKSQKELQIDARSDLPDYDREINRHFYVVDVYNAGEQFLFVYLDENQNDPMLYEAYLPQNQYEVRPWVHSLNRTLSEFIDYRLNLLKQGYNPF